MKPTIQFNSYSNEYSFLSNFYESSFMFQGMEFPTVEHAYQAMKFQEFPEIQEQIRICPSVKEVKRLGKKAILPSDWNKDLLMFDLLWEKFKDPKLSILLRRTHRFHLVEDSFWDRSENSYWGIGKNGKGSNRLGEILMIVRKGLFLYKPVQTSYYAKTKSLPGENLIAISQVIPPGFPGASCEKLTPEAKTLWEFKKTRDEELYTQRFLTQLHVLCPHEIVDSLGLNPILICYEGQNKFCHRHLVADWLTYYGYTVTEV